MTRWMVKMTPTGCCVLEIHNGHSAIVAEHCSCPSAAQIVREHNAHAAMREPLAALAALPISHLEKWKDDTPVFAINDVRLTVGDIRKAKAALALADQETVSR